MEKPTVLIIEPSARGAGGHYLDYALSARAALQEMNYPVLVLANRQIDRELHDDVIPTFTYGFWEAYSIPRSPQITFLRVRGPIYRVRLLLARLYETFAIKTYYNPVLFRWRHQPRKKQVQRHIAEALLLPMMLLGGAERGPFKFITKRRAKNAVTQREKSAKTFVSITSKELVKAVDSLGKERVILMFTTCRENEVDIARRVLLARRSTYAVLLIRTPLLLTSQRMRHDDAMPLRRDSRLARKLARARNRFFGRMALVTDSEALTADYNDLGTFKFSTLPIPHTIVGPLKARTGPIRISYLGDARTEKGFSLLPAVLKILLATSGALPFQLFIQCNFNIPSGEFGIADSLETLRDLLGDRAEFCNAPLARDAYRAKLQCADIVLLLYDKDHYLERSSGIAVEALSAGAAVVVPSGTWLFEVCRESYYQQLDIERQHRPLLSCRSLRSSGRHRNSPDLTTISLIGGRILESGDLVCCLGETAYLEFAGCTDGCEYAELSFRTDLVIPPQVIYINIDLISTEKELIRRISRQEYVYTATDYVNHLCRSWRCGFSIDAKLQSIRVNIVSHDMHIELNDVALRLFGPRRVAGPPKPRAVLVYGDPSEVPELLADELQRRLMWPDLRTQPWAGSDFHNQRRYGEVLNAVFSGLEDI